MDSKILEAARNASPNSANAHIFQSITDPCFVVIDWKGYYDSKGEKDNVELHCDTPVLCVNGLEVGGITVHNLNHETIKFDLMKDNALYKSRKKQYSQCETFAYPDNFNFTDEWVLMMEMKYIKNIEAAVHDSLSYPNKMIAQIKDTTAFLRNNQIVNNDIMIYAAVAFPNFDISAYKDFFFMRMADEIEDLKINENIYIRPSSNVQINSRTDLDLI